MKIMKYLVAAASVITLASLAATSPASAAATMADTKHDLSFGSTGGVASGDPATPAGTDQICVFCHTPHSATVADGPLWNRTQTSATFSMYASSTVTGAVNSTPNPASAACLSCHDGTIAFDALLNQPGAGGGAPTGWTFTGPTDKKMGTISGTTAVMDTDLRNEHPVSIVYTTSGAGLLAIPLNGIKLFDDGANDNVECASCHNPHDDTNSLFLRTSNAASALCVSCHDK